MPYLTTHNGKILLALYIQPQASKNKFCGLHGDEMKLAITAPPVDGKANKGVLQFVAKVLGVAKGAVSIQRGLQSRHKHVLVDGIDSAAVREKIERGLG